MKTSELRPGVLAKLRAVRDELNEELAGKSFVEQQRYIRDQLKTKRRPAPRGRSRQRRSA